MKTTKPKHQIANKLQLANNRSNQTLGFMICILEFAPERSL